MCYSLEQLLNIPLFSQKNLRVWKAPCTTQSFSNYSSSKKKELNNIYQANQLEWSLIEIGWVALRCVVRQQNMTTINFRAHQPASRTNSNYNLR